MVNTKSDTKSQSSSSKDSGLQRITQLIKDGKANKIVVLTGAGISTSAGIPDFRSPETGLYANLEKLNLPFPEAVFELNYFRRNPKPFWTLAKDLYPGKYYPTTAHYFLKLLHTKNKLLRVFSQNIDTLESLAGLPSSHIIEAHGSFATAHCLSCRKEVSREYVLSSGVRNGEVVRCKDCKGLVKPDIVFFGEGLPERFFKSLGDLKQCDLLIIIGTSLQVQPFANLPSSVSSTTPRLLINREAVGPFTRLPSSRSTNPGETLDNKAKSGLDSDDEEDEKKARSISSGRDIFWGGDADEGCMRLAEELGWADELRILETKGRKHLEKLWKVAEGKAKGESSVVDSKGAEKKDAVKESRGLAEAIKKDVQDKSGKAQQPEAQNAEELGAEEANAEEGDEESSDEEAITGKINTATIDSLNELIRRQLQVSEEGEDTDPEDKKPQKL